jgi:hypothetical protein
MEEATQRQEFLKADEKLRIITTGGLVSYEEQEDVIRNVVVDAIADPIVFQGPTSEIAPDGPLGVDLHDLNKTAYFSEAQFRILDIGSPYRYLATTGVANCLSVFASTPTGKSFGAHLNLVSMYYSLEEVKSNGGGVFQNMVDALQKAFWAVDTSEITISIVGGWLNADLGTKRKQIYHRTQEHMWSFSSVVLECLQQALPGAIFDTSRLNSFQGVSWEDRTQKTKLKCIVDGDAYRFVVLDTLTGVVHVQRTNLGDFCLGKGGGVMFPAWVLISSLSDLAAMHARVAKFRETIDTCENHESVLQEHVDKDNATDQCIDMDSTNIGDFK